MVLAECIVVGFLCGWFLWIIMKKPEKERRDCMEHSLWMHSAPAIFSLAKIETFFAPVAIKKDECLDATNKSTLRKVRFFTQEDLEWALKEKLWQYIDDHCIRLSTTNEDPRLDGAERWNVIHGDLQLDILSYFDVFNRSKFRRVCKEWNVELKHHWDGKVNHCLYFDFESLHCDKTLLKARVKDAVRFVDESSSDQCSRVPRLVLKYHKFTWAKDADLTVRPGRFFDSDEPSFLQGYLVRHSHFSTVMLINMVLLEFTCAGGIFTFGGTVRWPRELNVIFHQCRFHLSHWFPAHVNQDHDPTPGRGSVFPVEFMYTYSVEVQCFTVQLGPNVTAEERYRRFHIELDKGRILWPFPAKQLDWLRSLLANCPLDEDGENEEQEDEWEEEDEDEWDEEAKDERPKYSSRQAIRMSLKKDPIRLIVGNAWTPTGVFFEGMQLSWRDCLVLALATNEWKLLGPTPPPCNMDDFDVDLDFACWSLPKETAQDLRQFQRQVGCVQEDGSAHCLFDPSN